MKGSYRTPGVYVRWQDALSDTGTEPVRMDIAGFMGIAQRGPVGTPVRIQSWGDFVGMFGNAIPEAYLGFAVRGFFQNGGKVCWVVRTADPDTAFPAVSYLVQNTTGEVEGGKSSPRIQQRPVAKIYAASPGTWGGDVEIAMAHRGAKRFDLTVTLGGEIYENWRNLSLKKGEDNFIEDVIGRPDIGVGTPGPGSRLIRARVWYPRTDTISDLSPIGFLSPRALASASGAPASTQGYSLTTALTGGTDGLQPCAIVKGVLSGGRYVGPSGTLLPVDDAAHPWPDPPNLMEVRAVMHGAGTGATVTAVTVFGEAGKGDAHAFSMSIQYRDADGKDCETVIGRPASDPAGAARGDKEPAPLSLRDTSENYILRQLDRDPEARKLIVIRDLKAWPGRDIRLLGPGGGKKVYVFGDGLTASHFATIDQGRGMSFTPDALQRRPALDTLSEVWEIGLLAAPDLMPKPRPEPADAVRRCVRPDLKAAPSESNWRGDPPVFHRDEIRKVQEAMLRECLGSRYRFAILDPPPPEISATVRTGPPGAEESGEDLSETAVNDVVRYRSSFGGPVSQFGALYFPWLEVGTDLPGAPAVLTMPPSGHMAGVFARVDDAVGIHKAPANELVAGAQAATLGFPESVLGYLNAKDINVIRMLPGRGLRVLGARTLIPSGASDGRLWRYVNVRRLVSMIEKTVDVSTQWMVFEPNDRHLWQNLDRVARSLLTVLWRKGMLDGATPEDAYFVRCNEATNPPEQIDLGMVVTEIGLRPPWPAEFLTLRLVKTAAEVSSSMTAEEAP